MSKIFSRQIWLSDWMIIGYFAAVKLALHLAAISEFGYCQKQDPYWNKISSDCSFNSIHFHHVSLNLTAAIS